VRRIAAVGIAMLAVVAPASASILVTLDAPSRDSKRPKRNHRRRGSSR
jgi:hypothetical protein